MKLLMDKGYLKLFIVGVFCYSQLTLHGQAHSTQEIINKAKAYLVSQTHTSLEPFYILDNNSYYTYKKGSNQLQLKKLTDSPITAGKIMSPTHVRFWLEHPELKDLKKPVFLSVVLDSQLTPVHIYDLQAIPDFLMNEEPCPWITREDLQAHIQDLDFKHEVVKLEKNIVYDRDTKRYSWEIINLYLEKKCSTKGETINLDANTGKLVKRSNFETVRPHCDED
jgi:hypothetical protein